MVDTEGCECPLFCCLEIAVPRTDNFFGLSCFSWTPGEDGIKSAEILPIKKCGQRAYRMLRKLKENCHNGLGHYQ